MAALDRSIFRQRAVEKHIQKRERHVILRLVSPPMFVFLWVLLALSVAGGALVWTIQEPVVVQGKGVVVEQNVANTKTAQKIIVLLLLPTNQQANLKVGQPVRITIGSNIIFNSTIDQVEKDVMSPTAISSKYTAQAAPLAQTLSGPAVVATAAVEPMSQAQTYLGSQCQAQIQIGSESIVTMLPGIDNLSPFFSTISQQWHRLFK
ncbi:hypothetical protein KSF_076960 [Reticulibacter mediterranei]|uniref:Uncharacterized protein n=1 Tax=Reticulibacter mediterranei TaxID=2778369 RepID=A0A8J3IS69_9CHLR|nr:hypothetical protein [Reticulibacter mediterranei]GHO97648.1 hypothetical protein KSF_076960 [Reticulibacter mediterranei]